MLQTNDRSAPLDSEQVAGSAGTQTWLAGLGTAPAGVPRQTGASGDDRSGTRKLLKTSLF